MKNKNKIRNKAIVFLAIAISVGSSYAYSDNRDLNKQENLSAEDLKNLDESDLEKDRINQFAEDDQTMSEQRLLAVQEAAMVVGSQHGYVDRLNKLKDQFLDVEESLDDQWDFALIMRLAHGDQNGQYLIPPAIQEVDDVRKLSQNEMTITHSEKVYKIIRPERLSLKPPNWRSYLIKDQNVDVTLPSRALFPETRDEKRAWERAISEGWEAGEEQAEREMSYRVERMASEFQGMVRYLRLIEQGKMEETKVAYSHEQVQADSSEMHEDRHVFNIAVPSSFNDNNEEWEPIIITPRDSFSFPIEKGSEVDLMER